LNAACDYTGSTLLTTSGGTASQLIVRLGVVNALPITTIVTIDGQNGTGSGRYTELNLNGFDQELAGLTNVPRTSRAQRIVNSDVSAAATLTINNTDDFIYSASLGSGANGSVNDIPTPGSTNGNNFGLTKKGAGFLTLKGNNTFYGPTKIIAGIISLGNELALHGSPIDTQNSIAGDADNGLETTVAALTFGGLTGNKNLAAIFNTFSGGYSDVTGLTLKPGTGANYSYSGVIADGAVGMTLTKSGAGTQTLSGANTYTGATTVAAGTLALVGGSQTSPITVNSGAFLGFTLGSPTTSTAAVTFDAGSGVAITGEPVSATTYTLFTTAAAITGLPILASNIPGFVLQVDGGNTLKLVPVAPGSYAAWQSANETTEAAHLDHDNDGVANGIEFFLGGSTDTTGFTALPGVTNAAGTLSVTWTKDATYTGAYGVGFVVETSATLDGPWVTEIADPNAGYTVSFPSANEVKYTFPSPLGTKNFARLKVTP
jgi:autotransporter-associated beta strand protein